MSKKEIKFGNIPRDSKKVKINRNPESYKSMRVCWQFNLMDFDFEHGWNNVIERLRFTKAIKDSLLEDLLESDTNNNELYNIIDELKLNDYVTLSDFFDSITKNTQISFQELRVITRHIKNNFFWGHLFQYFKDLESKLWGELESETFGRESKSKHHWSDVSKLSKEAQKRLEELKLDDHEALFSIRLNGKNRLWGIRENNYFQVLWFDFDHKVYPVGDN